MGDHCSIVNLNTLDNMGMMYNHCIRSFIHSELADGPVPHLGTVQTPGIIFRFQTVFWNCRKPDFTGRICAQGLESVRRTIGIVMGSRGI